MDWDTWLAAHGHTALRPAASMRFDTYEQMIQAAVRGQGVAMGIGRLVGGLMASGALVAPFGESREGDRAYFVLRSAFTRDRPQVEAFVAWLVEEARMAVEGGDTPAPTPS
jgi:LysR family glycine cleavage system transcriptional activator